MKKEIFIGAAGAIIGAAATFGFDLVKAKFFTLEDPLNNAVIELSLAGKELILEQKNLIASIDELSKKATQYPEISIELHEISNRVTNIVQTAISIETQSRDIRGIANTIKSTNHSAAYNPNADLILEAGQAVTVCGNENTLGVESISNSGKSATIYFNDLRTSASIGEEYRFDSPLGASMISYLGQNQNYFEFRIVCGTAIKK